MYTAWSIQSWTSEDEFWWSRKKPSRYCCLIWLFLTFKALVISASIFSCLNNTVCVFEMRRKLCTLDMLKTCRWPKEFLLMWWMYERDRPWYVCYLNSSVKVLFLFNCLAVLLVVIYFLSTECLARLGSKPVFISAVGTDPLGVMMLKHCEEANMVIK